MDGDKNTGGSEMPRNKLLKRFWGALPAIFLILMIIVVIGLFTKIKAESDRLKAEKLASFKKERPPVNVVVLTASPHSIRDRLKLPGVIEPWMELNILAEVPGKVIEVSVDEGQSVKKGDVIARIDKRDYENALASARASYELALKSLGRTANLYEKELVPKAELDNAQANSDMLRAAMKNAELAFERTEIRAPISGIVNKLDAKEGLLLGVSDPVAQILDIRRVKVNIGIPESDVDEVRKLEAVDIEVDALGGTTFRGSKLFLSKAPDNLARLYKLQLGVDNPSGKLLPGMFVNADIVKREVTKGISVPLYSVISRDEGRFVYVEKDGIGHARLVETGILEGWLIEITKGVEAGDRVVVVGQRSLNEGQSVNVVREIGNPEELFK